MPTKRISFEVHGRNGHYPVEKFNLAGEHPTCPMAGLLIMLPNKRVATEVANALNDAYRDGYRQGQMDERNAWLRALQVPAASHA